MKPIFGTAGPGEVKTNQDRGLVTYPVGENPRQALLCVFDGHGKAGEEVSEFVMLRFPDLLEADKDRLSDPEQREKCLEENVLLVDRVLKESQCPSATNGTTACIMLVQELAGQALTVTLANVGDSRAVKGTLAVDASTGAERWATSDLTSDHKPDLPEERKRVEQSAAASPRRPSSTACAHLVQRQRPRPRDVALDRRPRVPPVWRRRRRTSRASS